MAASSLARTAKRLIDAIDAFDDETAGVLADEDREHLLGLRHAAADLIEAETFGGDGTPR